MVMVTMMRTMRLRSMGQSASSQVSCEPSACWLKTPWICSESIPKYPSLKILFHVLKWPFYTVYLRYPFLGQTWWVVDGSAAITMFKQKSWQKQDNEPIHLQEVDYSRTSTLISKLQIQQPSIHTRFLPQERAPDGRLFSRPLRRMTWFRAHKMATENKANLLDLFKMRYQMVWVLIFSVVNPANPPELGYSLVCNNLFADFFWRFRCQLLERVLGSWGAHWANADLVAPGACWESLRNLLKLRCLLETMEIYGAYPMQHVPSNSGFDSSIHQRKQVWVRCPVLQWLLWCRETRTKPCMKVRGELFLRLQCGSGHREVALPNTFIVFTDAKLWKYTNLQKYHHHPEPLFQLPSDFRFLGLKFWGMAHRRIWVFGQMWKSLSSWVFLCIPETSSIMHESRIGPSGGFMKWGYSKLKNSDKLLWNKKWWCCVPHVYGAPHGQRLQYKISISFYITMSTPW